MTVQRGLPPSFPTRPQRMTNSIKTFPSDLLAGGRNMYMQIQMIPYSASLVWPYSVSANPVGGVVLPIPMKLNDVQPIIWQEVSIMDNVAQASMNYLWSKVNALSPATQRRFGVLSGSVTAGAAAASVLTGYQVNPMLWMMFRSPGFKEFTFSWQFIANNADEAQDLVQIRDYLRRLALPEKNRLTQGFLYEYPWIALIRLYPNNDFTMRFKPCAVLGIEMDYTGGGVPSFHKDGSATVINMNLMVKEIDLWTKDNYYI